MPDAVSNAVSEALDGEESKPTRYKIVAGLSYAVLTLLIALLVSRIQANDGEIKQLEEQVLSLNLALDEEADARETANRNRRLEFSELAQRVSRLEAFHEGGQ